MYWRLTGVTDKRLIYFVVCVVKEIEDFASDCNIRISLLTLNSFCG